MNVTYTGKLEIFYPTQQGKLEGRFAKLGKLLDGAKGDKVSRVVLAKKRNLHRAEVTVNYMDHQLVGEASDADQYLAITSALDKLEKQVLKVRQKRRDTKKVPVARTANMAAAAVEPERMPARNVAPANGKRRVFRVDHSENVKPITLEEAMLELEKPGEYVVYRDANKDCLSVLLMRADGHFDLIEG
jgi:ribosomal subunit interface protein